MEYLKQKNYTIVDVETTGGSAAYDRIIEIGILRIENGKIVKTYKQLINPQKSLSPTIESITGIASHQLLGAPLFEEIAPDILELMKDAVFVAHNARFDYGFIKNEFKRAGISYNAKCLCTVRLSRKLFPEHAKHDLSSIIDRFNLNCENRHRAFDDARALYDFLLALEAKKEDEEITKAINSLLHQNTLPQFLDERTVDRIPETPGVYIFYGPEDEILYIGKSRNLRYRVLSHFSNDHLTSKEMNICQQVTRIETRQTPGELGALLLESQLIKELGPLYNRQLRKVTKLVVAKKISQVIKGQTYFSVSLDRVDGIEVNKDGEILGIFRSISQASLFLKNASDEFKLCPKLIGLEKTNSKNPTSCFYYQLDKCNGACCGKEEVSVHNDRLLKAFDARRIKAWPFGRAILIEEKKNDIEKQSFVLDNWCLLADIKSDEDDGTITTHTPQFDYDSYKIFARYISDPANQRKLHVLTKKELDQIICYTPTYDF